METGKIMMVTDETRRHLEQIYEEETDEDLAEEDIDIRPVLEKLSLSDWIKRLCWKRTKLKKSSVPGISPYREPNQVKLIVTLRILSPLLRTSSYRKGSGRPLAANAPSAASRMS